MTNRDTGETLLDMPEEIKTPTTLYPIKKTTVDPDPTTELDINVDVRVPPVRLDFIDVTTPNPLSDPADTDLDVAPTAITTIPGPRYECVELLGRGAMADVYKARDRRLSKPWRDVHVAVKVFCGASPYGAQAPIRIDNEVVAARDVKDPHVCQVYDVLEFDDDYPAIVMEYIEGKTLGSIIRSGAKIDYLTGASWAAEIALGLAAAHDKNIVHRDLKPDNVMIRAKDARAVILDFGVAKFFQLDVTLTQKGVVLGTPLFMAPERFEGFTDPRSDLYALALILGLMFTGKVPLCGDRSPNDAYRVRVHERQQYRLKDHDPRAPVELARIVDRLLEYSPDARFQTGADVAEALKAFIADSQAETKPSMQPAVVERVDRDIERPASDALIVPGDSGRTVVPIVALAVALAMALAIILFGTLANAGLEKKTESLETPSPYAVPANGQTTES